MSHTFQKGKKRHLYSCENLPCLTGKSLAHPAVSAVNTGSKQIPLPYYGVVSINESLGTGDLGMYAMSDSELRKTVTVCAPARAHSNTFCIPPFHFGQANPKAKGVFPMLNHRKAAVIGCGLVGSACAFSLIQRGLFSELVLIDANRDKAEGEAMDLSHGLPYIAAMDVYAGTYDDLSDCALIVVTAGANQKPGQTRLELIGQNVSILNSIIPQITARPFEGILLIVSNPVDVLTYAAFRISGYPAHRVMGSGTVLDSARLRYLLGEHLNVDSRSIHAVIVGEHGDSELAVWSGANVSGVPLDDFCEMRGHTRHREAEQRIYEEVRDSAYEIIKRKGATYYGIAMAVARIAECVMKDERAILPVSVVLGGQYGLRDLALSIPSIVGRRGVEQILEIPLADGEREALNSSAAQLREVIGELELP